LNRLLTKYGGLIRSAGMAFGVFLLLLCMSSYLPLTWDEGVMSRRSDQLSSLVQQVTKRNSEVPAKTPAGAELENGDQSGLLQSVFAVRQRTSFCFSDEGHPGFPVFLNSLGQTAAPSILPFKTRLRFGNICFFSLAAGAVFFRLKKDFNTETAVFGIVSILFIPRLFAHIQIAHYDSPLISAWLLSWACFPAALKSLCGSAVFGCCIGLTAGSKFAGCGVLLPPFLWLAIRLIANRLTMTKSRFDCCFTDWAKRFAVAVLSALFIFWIFNSSLWFHPITGIGHFIDQNTHRTLNISILFFNTFYDLYHSLPWYNTIVWTAITVPVGLLILFLTGCVVIVRDAGKRWAGLWIFLNMTVLLLMRALPGTPVHDGVRLFVPAMAFLAMIAAVGAAAAMKRKKTAEKPVVRLLPVFSCYVIYATCLFNLFWYAPQWLSFYNLAIGGLPGAVRAGMEPTYYWDGLDGEVLNWLQSNVGKNEQVLFSAHSAETIQLCFNDRNIKIPYKITAQKTTFAELKGQGCRYYILQRRPSAEFECDKILRGQYHPVFVKTIRQGGAGAWNLGSVPIIEIYDLNEL
jgi:hypothetical protein